MQQIKDASDGSDPVPDISISCIEPTEYGPEFEDHSVSAEVTGKADG